MAAKSKRRKIKVAPYDSADYLKTEADIKNYLEAVFEEPMDRQMLIHALAVVPRGGSAAHEMSALHSANASNAASGSSPAYNLLANARRRSRRVRSRGSEDSMMARAVSNIEEAILMRRSGVMSL